MDFLRPWQSLGQDILKELRFQQVLVVEKEVPLRAEIITLAPQEPKAVSVIFPSSIRIVD